MKKGYACFLHHLILTLRPLSERLRLNFRLYNTMIKFKLMNLVLSLSKRIVNMSIVTREDCKICLKAYSEKFFLNHC